MIYKLGIPGTIMFKFLKGKLKEAVSNISKKIERESKEEEVKVEEIKDEIKKKVEKEAKERKGIFSFLKREKKTEPELKKKTEKKAKIKKEKISEKKAEEEPVLEVPFEIVTDKVKVDEAIKSEVEKEEKKLGIFGKFKEKITTKKISEDKFGELFEELEIVLLENNVAIEVVENLKENLKKELVDKPLLRRGFDHIIKDSLKVSVENLFVEGFDVLERIKTKKPFVIAFVGINGGGKTTTIAKFARLLLDNKKTCVLAAADTFRAAAISQLEEHGNRLGVKVIKHDYGSDSAAVAFDAIKHAEAKHIDVVLIDTAGRLHSNKDLIREMEKIIRVSKPDLTIFVGESITGNDCIEQARSFNEAVGIGGIILTKVDVDDKGGTALSISYVTKVPILFLGTGQSMNDLKKFDKEEIIKDLGF